MRCFVYVSLDGRRRWLLTLGAVVISYHLINGCEHPRMYPVYLGVCGKGISAVLHVYIGCSARRVLILDIWDRSADVLWRHGR
jgi:hypothetical protein